MRKVTIVDIAKEANVSISTVSRVINGSDHPVKESVKEEVRRVMEKLDYHPNAVARSLRKSQTHLVAFVVADISNRFFMEIAKGLEGELLPEGYQLVISATDGDPEKERRIIQLLLDRQVDGLVLASANESVECAEKCMKSGTPLVLVDRPVESDDINQVIWPDEQTAFDLTSKLIENGHKKIGIVNVSLNASTGKKRLAGFTRALEEAGIQLKNEYVSGSNFDVEQAYSFAKEVLSLPNRPTALLCSNNVMLVGTLRAIRELNLEIKKDIALVVFGNAECNEYITPQITSATQDSILMGKTAGEMMKELLKGKEGVSKAVIPTGLFLGQSC